MNKVKARPEYIAVLSSGMVDGILCIAVSCANIDEYKSLPGVVSDDGTLCGKTGWNSDRGIAYYQSNTHIVKIEST